jgi:hypothetical protein
MTRRAAHRPAALALAGLLLGCQGGPPAPRADASLSVEVMRGFAVPRAPLASAPPRIAVVVDVTRSMAEPTPEGPTRAEAALGGARELIRALPADAAPALRVLGARDAGAACVDPVSLAAAPRDALLAELRVLEPRAEGSLAAALEAVAADLRAAGGADGARVAVFTDFDDPCGGELCAAAAALVAEGAWIDWLALGPAAPPACLAELAPNPRAAGPIAAGLASEPPGYLVLSADAAPDAPALAAGRAGAAAVGVPPGLVTLVVDLDPLERIGPFPLAAGERVQVRLLDFPMAMPPQRVWRIERAGERWDPSFPDAPAWRDAEPSGG